MNMNRITLKPSDNPRNRGLMAALDTAHALIWFDGDGRIEEANAKAQALFTLSVDRLLGRSLADLAGEGRDIHRRAHHARHWDAILTGRVRAEQRLLFIRDHRRVPCILTYTAVPGQIPMTVERVLAQITPNDAVAQGTHTPFTRSRG